MRQHPGAVAISSRESEMFSTKCGQVGRADDEKTERKECERDGEKDKGRRVHRKKKQKQKKKI